MYILILCCCLSDLNLQQVAMCKEMVNGFSVLALWSSGLMCKEMVNGFSVLALWSSGLMCKGMVNGFSVLALWSSGLMCKGMLNGFQCLPCDILVWTLMCTVVRNGFSVLARWSYGYRFKFRLSLLGMNVCLVLEGFFCLFVFYPPTPPPWWFVGCGLREFQMVTRFLSPWENQQQQSHAMKDSFPNTWCR